MEVDFPRGGRKKKAPVAEDSAPKKRKTNESDAHGSQVKLKNEAYEGVFKQNVSFDLLTPGVRGLGCVYKIYDESLLLKTVNGISIHVAIENIGRVFIQNVSKTGATLQSVFKIGQLVAFKIETKSDRTVKGKLPGASICPYMVNSCLNSTTLYNGLVVNAAIKSIEEKGAVIDLGIEGKIQGFAPSDVLPDMKSLVVGQVMLFRIMRESGDSKRFIKVSAYPEMDTMEEEGLTTNHLMPGTVLHADPAYKVDEGLIVNFKNNLKALVRTEHLPPRVRKDVDKIVRTFRVVVVLCNQNSPLLVVSGHPDVVALSKVEKRTVPPQFAIGSTFEAQVYNVDSRKNVYLSMADGDKVALVTAKMPAANLEDADAITKFYPGTTHKVKAVKFNPFDRQMIVTNKKDILKTAEVKEMLSPGQRVTAVVKGITDNGLLVEVGANTKGMIPKVHALDLPLASWKKAFKIGQKVKCRVLNFDKKSHAYYLTAKPTVIDSPEDIIVERSMDVVKKTAIGTVMSVKEPGAVVLFFGNVTGFLPRKEFENSSDIKVGVPVKVHIRGFNPDTKRINLSIGEPIKISKKNAEKEKRLKRKAVKNLGIYTAKIAGPWPYGGTSSETSILVSLPSGNVGRLHVSEIGPIKETKKPVQVFLKQYQGKSVNVRIIDVTQLSKLPVNQRELLTKADLTRFFECSVNPKKLNETKRKQALFRYERKFNNGNNVSAYLIDSSRSKFQRAEINPHFRVQVVPESTSCTVNEMVDEFGFQSAVPIMEGNGKQVEVRVLSRSNKGKGKAVLNVTLCKAKTPLTVGKEYVGRILSVSQKPLIAKVALEHGQTGLLRASAMTNERLDAKQLVKVVKADNLYNFRVLESTSDGWLIAGAKKTNIKTKKFVKGTEYCGYVVEVNDDESAVVEFYPGIQATLKHDRPFMIDDLVVANITSGTSKAPEFTVTEVIRGVGADSESNACDEDTSSDEAEDTDSDAEAEDESDEEVNESDVEMVGADGKDMVTSEVKNALRVLRSNSNIWEPKAISKEKLLAVKTNTENTVPEPNKEEKRKKKRRTSENVEADDESPDENLSEHARILHKEKTLANLEKSLELCNDTDFDRLVLSNPNSAEVWISYMIYQAQNDNIDEARRIAETALSTIDVREEKERLNVYTALLNLEVSSGDKASLKAVFQRACGAFDSLEVHERLAKVYAAAQKDDELEDLYKVMTKKFGHEIKVWGNYGTFLFKNGKSIAGRELMKRALLVVPKKQHLQLLSRFASLEFEYGDAEFGKTMFEKAVAAAPKRGDVWNVYVDKAIKFMGVDDTRAVFERAITANLGNHTVKNLLQKWHDFESLRGDAEHVLEVEQKIAEFSEKFKKEEEED